MRKVLQQGQADGLCGLYAALNFLNRTEWRSWAKGYELWYLLDACRHFGWLTSQFLTEGFEDYQLKAILDLQFLNYRLPFATHFLSDVAEAYSSISSRELYERIVRKRGSVIVQNRRGGHWLLVTGKNGQCVVCDSADAQRSTAPISDRRLSEALGWGVAILPRKRPVTTVDI